MTPAASAAPDAGAARRTAEAVWRIESARLIAGLARVAGDVGLAEDLAQDALVAALEQWPATGVPDNPGAWLTTVARRRYVDGVRRQAVFDRKAEQIGRELAEAEDPMDEIEFDAHVEDDVLRLIFTACHPVLSRDARVALTLKLVAGLSTEQIARAFLVSTPTMAARVTRAKKALSDARVPFEVPVGAELEARLASVLEVVYLIFNEGYTGGGARASGERAPGDLANEALRLGRALAGLMPDEAEVHGLLALMLLHDSRRNARFRDGDIVLLADQDRSLWDTRQIEQGRAVLDRALALRGHGPYVVQAAIASLHVDEPRDWPQIAALYGELARLTDSPVVELNRAVAVSEAEGPQDGLELADRLTGLDDYRYFHSSRGEMLRRLGRTQEAREAYARAIALAHDDAERRLFQRRLAELESVSR